MASNKVHAFLERTKALGRPQGETKPAPVQDFPPEVPVKSIPDLPDSVRDRSPTFSSKPISPPETQKAPLMSIKERVALVLPRAARKRSPRFSTPPKASMTSPKGKPPRASERKASTGRSLSVPKRQSSPARPTPEITFDRAKLPDLERLLNTVVSSRSALQAKLQEQFEKEKELVDLVKSAAKRSGERKTGSVDNPEQMAKIEEAYKEKTQKMLAVVKEEVMVMDRKLADLMQENTRLKELVVISIQTNKRKEADDKGESRSSSRSGFSDKPKQLSASEVLLDSMESHLKPTQESEYIDRNDIQIKHIFSNLEQTSSTEAYRELCIHLAKKMIFERRHRLRTETQARDMMDQQEKTIANLKDKISQYDGRSSAMLSLRESPREEFHVFQDS